MLFTFSSNGRTRECDNCGTITAVTHCYVCGMNICDGCDHACAEPKQSTTIVERFENGVWVEHMFYLQPDGMYTQEAR